MNKFDEFVETVQAQNTKKVVKSLQAVCEYDYSNCTAEDVKQVVLGMNPNSVKSIITICYVIGLYAKYLGNNELYNIVQGFDKNSLWAEAKPNAPRKYISHDGFEEVVHDIGIYEDYNGFYQQVLFRCVYEGIYNDDMSVIKNLRASDINGNVITLREDNGHTYDLEVSAELAKDLLDLSTQDKWERKNRYGSCQVGISGVHHDSCFKVEIRKGASEYSYRYSYYRILRKIAKEYVEYNLLPLQIYISGMTYRIGLKLSECGISLEDAFANQNRDRVVGKIIADELKRCNCDTEVRNFRQMVKGHLEVFTH